MILEFGRPVVAGVTSFKTIKIKPLITAIGFKVGVLTSGDTLFGLGQSPRESHPYCWQWGMTNNGN